MTVYLDNNATTRPAACVVEAMLPYLRDCYFNPSASSAAFTGADRPQRDARVALAKLFNAEEPECFAFTSGATESNNWVFASLAGTDRRGTVVVSAIEHASVSEPAEALRQAGFRVINAPVDGQGLVRLDALRATLSDDTVLVSVVAANNETGVIQSLDRLGAVIRECAPCALFHTDATQAVGKIPIDLQGAWEEVDLLSFSAHKFHGPKGVGGLFVRPGIQVRAMLLGGGQERGLRSGTPNTAALAGLAAAVAEVDLAQMDVVATLRDEFEQALERAIAVTIHSRRAPRLPNTSCFSIAGADGEGIAHDLAARGVIVGTGSACSAGAMKPPKTVLALGVEHSTASGTLRVSLSRFTTRQELRILLERLIDALRS